MEIITVIAVIATFGSIWWSVGNAQASRDKLSAALSEIETLKSKPSSKAKNSKKADQGDQSSLKSEIAVSSVTSIKPRRNHTIVSKS